MIGRSNKKLAGTAQKNLLLLLCGFQFGNVRNYRRIFFKGEMIQGTSYAKVEKRCNTVVAVLPPGILKKIKNFKKFFLKNFF